MCPLPFPPRAGATPLAVTVLCHHAAAVEALLEAGADVHATLPPWNAPATGGAAWTLLDLCLRDPLVGVREEALGDGDMPRILAALLDAGDDPLAPRRLSKDGGDRGEATCPLLEAARGREGRRSPLVAPMLAHVLRMREEGRLDGGAILRGAHAALLVGEADTALRLLDGWEEERALPADWLPLLR